MHRVKVRRTGVTADEAADVIRRELGDGVRAEPDGGEVKVSKGTLGKARVTIISEPGGTAFEVRGTGTFLVIPSTHVITRLISDRGIARRTAEVIGQAREFREDG